MLKSKAPVTCHEYGDRYTMIGPLSYKTAPLEVETLEPDTPELRLTLESMKERGVKFLYGRWLIEGAPKVLLFDTGSVYHKLDEWKGDLWNVAGIPSPPNDHETNEAILFGYLVAWFLGEVSTPFFCFTVQKALFNHLSISPSIRIPVLYHRYMQPFHGQSIISTIKRAKGVQILTDRYHGCKSVLGTEDKTTTEAL